MGKVRDKEIQTPMYTFHAEIPHPFLKGLDLRINLDKPLRNFRDAMTALDKQAWAAAYNSEYPGFQPREVFEIIRPQPGVRIHYTI